MKSISYHKIMAMLIGIALMVMAANAQPLSAIEFKDTTGATPTARIGWTGTAANGHFFVKTPTQTELIKSSASGIEVSGNVKATSFSGSGNGLYDGSVPLTSVNGLADSLLNKAQKNHTHPVASIPWDSVTGKPAGLLDSIPDNSVTSAKVKDSSLTGADINSSTDLFINSVQTKGNISVGSSLAMRAGAATLQSSLISGGITQVLVRNEGGNQLNFQVVGDIISTGSCCQTSDERFKKEVVPIQGCLEKLQTIRPVEYVFNCETYPEKSFPNKKQIGVIAQEIEQLFPEIVKTDQDGFKAVDYAKLSVVLLKAIQEQQQEIDELKAAIKK